MPDNRAPYDRIQLQGEPRSRLLASHPLPSQTDREPNCNSACFRRWLPGQGTHLGHAANGGEYALLGAGVFRNRNHRRAFGLWWNRVRCCRHCKDTVFHLRGRLCRNAADGADGQKKPPNLGGPKNARTRSGIARGRLNRYLVKSGAAECGSKLRSPNSPLVFRRKPGSIPPTLEFSSSGLEGACLRKMDPGFPPG